MTPQSLDRDVALTRVGGDADLLREIATLFLDNYNGWLAELHQAISRNDAAAVEHTAHGLKGSVANFGAHAAVAAALEVEKIARSRDLSHVTSSLMALENALDELRPELEAL